MSSCQAHSLWKIGWRLNSPPPAEGRGGAHYVKVSKKNISGMEWDSLWEVKIQSETKSLFPSCDTHRPNLYSSKIWKMKLEKEYAISSGTGENRTSQTVNGFKVY